MEGGRIRGWTVEPRRSGQRSVTRHDPEAVAGGDAGRAVCHGGVGLRFANPTYRILLGARMKMFVPERLYPGVEILMLMGGMLYFIR